MKAVDRSEQQTSEPPVILVDGLKKSYGELVALRGVSFSVWRGEVFGLLGPNGAGKTTTVEILEGMRTADAGTAIIAGIDVSTHPREVKAVIGVQLQSSAFFDRLTLTEILRTFASLYRSTVDPAELLRTVQLEDRPKSHYRELSGGQKQRFSIAVALVNDPPVVFLDEPTTGLDPQARRHMWEQIRTLQAAGKTIILTTHYMEEAQELCDRLAIMDGGAIVALDSPVALIDQLLARGFESERERSTDVRGANLEDVFLDLTGTNLREG